MSTDIDMRHPRKHFARPWIVAALLALWLALPAGRALAEDDYDAVLAEALAEFQRQNWIEARALFKRAHELKPNARTLRGSAVAAFEAKLYVDAYLELTAALASNVKPLTPKQRTDAQRILARTQLFVARVRIVVSPSDAELTIDGKPAVVQDGVTLLDPGVHDLAVHAAGYDPFTQRLDPEPGVEREMQIELREHSNAEVAAPVRAVEATPGDATPTNAAGAEPAHYGVWPWVAAGAAVVFAGAGIGLHLAASGAASDIEEACPASKCTLKEINTRIDDANIETYDTLSVVSFGLAGAAAVTSVVLFVLDAKSSQESPPATALRVGPGSVAISGRF